MSDFLFSLRPRPAGELSAVLARHPGLRAARLGEWHGPWGSLAVSLPGFEADAVCDDGGRISVVLGGPLVRLPGLAPGRIESGGRRALLHQRLSEGVQGEWLDGQFALLSIDGDAVTVCVDRFGHVPVFHAPAAGLVGTHVDAVALAAQAPVDPVSAADLVANLTCAFPFTLYEGVRQLQPGAVHHVRSGMPEPRVYWTPAERDTFPTLRAAADALRAGMVEGVRAACREADHAGVLLSGGEDSRAVLAAVPETTTAQAYIYAEWESREVRIARAAARAHGAQFEVALRSADHYERGFEDTARIVGSHHHFIDLHGYGLHERLALPALPVVLGGYSADSILKDRYWKARGTVPFRSPRLPGLRAELLTVVDQRRAAHYEHMRALRPRSAAEWQHVWPLSVRRHGGNIDGNRRLFRSWEAFHATQVLEVAAAAPLEWRRHRRLFHAAFRPLFRRTLLLPHAEYRFPYFGRFGNAALFAPLALARGVSAVARRETRARHRPWPKWGRVADSLAVRFRQLPDSPVNAILEPRGADAIGEWYSLRRLMFMQLAWLTDPAR